MSNKSLLIFYTTNQIETGIGFIRDIVSIEKPIIIALNLETQLYAEKNGLNCRLASSYAKRSTFDNIDIDAINFAKNWYSIIGIEDLLIYKNISLGAAIEYDMTFLFSTIFEITRLFIQIINVEYPNKIYIYDDSIEGIRDINPNNYEDIPAQIMLLLGKHLNIKVDRIQVKGNLDNNTNKAKLSKINYIKFFIKLTSILINFITSIKNYNKKNRYRILILDKLENVVRIIERLPNDDFLFANSKYGLSREIIKKIFRLNSNIKFKNYYECDMWTSLINVDYEHRASQIKWLNVKQDNDFGFAFTYFGVNLWPVMIPRIDYIFNIKYKIFIRDIESIEEFINRNNIQIVLLNNDVIYINKLFALICNEMNKKTLVLQHGIIFHQIGFLPLTANKIAVWGEEPSKWYQSHGVDKSRIEITGCPRFDMHDSKEETLKSEMHSRNFIILLVAPWFRRDQYLANIDLSEEDILEFFKISIKAVKAIPNCRLIIKFHPTDDKTKLYKKLMHITSTDSIKTTQYSKINELIEKCDAVISYNSSVNLEAIISKKPIINMTFNKKQRGENPYRGLDKEISNEQELAKEICKLMDCKGYYNFEFKKQNDIFSFKYKECFDGKSSERIAKLISKSVRV